MTRSDEVSVYGRMARYYDRMYAFKDYRKEAALLVGLLEIQGAERLTLLDVACGTGRHIEQLQTYFRVEGMDISSELLAVARGRMPGTVFHLGDMTGFDLGRRFDVVTCLFSSIGYTRTLEGLADAVRCMTAHVVPGGVLVIEPWFTPDGWRPNTVHSLFIDEPELKIARISTSFRSGRMSSFDLHHLIGTPAGTEHFVEHHEMGLFEIREMVSVMEDAGLTVTCDPAGLTGRGLYLGRKKTS